MKMNYKRSDGRKRCVITSDDVRTVPVIICDESLVIVDLNEAAEKKGLSELLFKSLTHYLTVRDSTLLGGLVSRTSSLMNVPESITVPITGMKGGKIALVTVKRYFGKGFLDIALFRSNTVMLNDFESMRKLLPPSVTAPEDYLLTRDGTDIELTAMKVDSLLASNLLLKLYLRCAEANRKKKLFNAAEILKLVVTRVVSRLESMTIKASCKFKDGEVFLYDGVDLSDFINFLVMIIYMINGISKTGELSVYAECDDRIMDVYFKTVLKEPDKSAIVNYSSFLIGDAYPQYASIAHIVQYMCDIMGLRFYTKVEDKDKFTGNLVITAPEREAAIAFHPPEEIDYASMIKYASSFASLFLTEDGTI